MAILDRLRKKSAPKRSVRKEKIPLSKPEQEKEQEKGDQETVFSAPLKAGARAETILRTPHVTEKAARVADQHNQYIFRVSERATKVGVAEAVEALYGIRPLRVRMVRIHRKRRRLGRTEGFRTGYKKALVKLPAGKRIELMPR